ncbi:hypothetical protein ACWT_5765 [Actinoplanes sp. SE50]|uniref:hypothetical protein n=1 Tax=unclassified Actinoplanes TaxID=2626549 RepID=UPI00023ED67A|nr:MULTISPECIES: hypothetical protein [unclassified Actinoplanes]AEV86783.1 hypothetical protein ACPL_5896 [Actinoplanes sp. SE50/110]ATO85180.1 hypothetical protein ACWT_5765 [Actinoplanes sp. SE50]SLM02590.1 hypothetical protein ACSP50_5872 [Actinoplanes sp. SE50/110]
MLARLVQVTVLVAALVAGTLAAPALADDGGGACSGWDCGSWGDQPGASGGTGSSTGGGGGGDGGCNWLGMPVPCDGGSLGWYDGKSCYLKPVAEGPAGDSHGGTGFWYWATCFTGVVLGGGLGAPVLRWYPTAQGPSPEELARRALATITLKPPTMGVDTAGLVFTPVWLWTAKTPNTWGPISASASAAGLTVTITARASQIVWQMGNGDSVTCTNPGTAQKAGEADRRSPTCGYDGYPQPSRTRPGGKYTITATTSWRVDWAGGGQTGVIDQTRVATTTVAVKEAQVVNQ